MARISNTAVRTAIVSHLQSDPALLALVDADSIYGPQVPALPAWPFVQYGAFSDLPLRASGLDGQTLVGAIHAFAKGPGENAVEDIGSAIATSLDLLAIPLTAPYPGRLRITYTGGQTLRDDADTNSWHRVVNLRVTVYT